MVVKQGACTSEKHQHFSYAIASHFRAASGIIQRNLRWADPEFHYIDLNAGSGIYQDADGGEIVGSPIRAIREAKNFPAQAFTMTFIEQNKRDIEKLQACVEAEIGDARHIKVGFFCGDNREALRLLAERSRLRSRPIFGLIFSDENGTGVPFDELASLYASNRKFWRSVDSLIYIAANSYNRVRIVHDRPFLVEQMQKVGKQHWIARRVSGVSKWTFLIGTNWSRKEPDKNGSLCGFPDFRRLGFVPVDTDEGRAVLDNLNTTKAERQERQISIGYDMEIGQDGTPYQGYAEYLKTPEFQAVKRAAFERAGGVCEACKVRPARDPHHIKYPPWGTYDIPENIQALCHECHCEAHGKPVGAAQGVA